MTPTLTLIAATCALLVVVHAASAQVPETVDGDTIRIGNERIRLLGFDTPEIRSARCEHERRLGLQAKARLRQLLASGRVQIERQGLRKDRYGRTLAKVFVNGRDVGETLVSEGLARPYYGGRRETWCGRMGK